ncbi:MAG: dihydropteroate synthase [Bacteroidota bacterium]|jgi:dihydropteroate synthase
MLSEYKPLSIKINHKLHTIDQAWIMGIVNTGMDSFYDGGKYHTIDAALQLCEKHITEGAKIIDIGGQSSKPGVQFASTETEIAATAPVIEAIKKRFPNTIVSIDTFRSEVAYAAINAGVDIINDISAGDDDPQMLDLVAQHQMTYIAMHKKGVSSTMQEHPQYENVSQAVFDYFKNKTEQFKEKGIDNYILDPGFGFGKTLEHNYQLFNHWPKLMAFNAPVLIGVSRKSMVYKLLETTADHALNGSSVLHSLALLQGAHILRVHDVAPAQECLKLIQQLRNTV